MSQIQRLAGWNQPSEGPSGTLAGGILRHGCPVIGRLDRDQREYILFGELQRTGVVHLMSGLLVGLTFVQVSGPGGLDGRQ